MLIGHFTNISVSGARSSCVITVSSSWTVEVRALGGHDQLCKRHHRGFWRREGSCSVFLLGNVSGCTVLREIERRLVCDVNLLLCVCLTTYGVSPLLYGTKLAWELSLCIPSTIEHLISSFTLFLTAEKRYAHDALMSSSIYHMKNVHSTLAKQENSERTERNPPH